jgi:hypothetical protein
MKEMSIPNGMNFLSDSPKYRIEREVVGGFVEHQLREYETRIFEDCKGEDTYVFGDI